MSELARDEALLWLNDRLGELFVFQVAGSRNGRGRVWGQGTLTHWSDGHPVVPDSDLRERLDGSYRLGETQFAVGERRVIILGDMLVLELGAGVWLRMFGRQPKDTAA